MTPPARPGQGLPLSHADEPSRQEPVRRALNAGSTSGDMCAYLMVISMVA